MKIAITGGTGFVGKHLAQLLIEDGHDVVILSRGTRPWAVESPQITVVQSNLDSISALTGAFEGCQAIAHCAGINREVGNQTYESLHINGTRNVLAAAKAAGVKHIVFTSYLRARPHCGSAYLESKAAAETLILESGLPYTLLRVGILYGAGDHMLSHLRFALSTLPVFGLVSLGDIRLRPVAIHDFCLIMKAALLETELLDKTVAVIGPEEMTLKETASRVAAVLKKNPRYLPTPLWALYAMAWTCEQIMKEPLVTIAQVRMLSEGISEPALAYDPLPPKLNPHTILDEITIRAAFSK